ncbi:hypothetical protein ACSBR2_030764 [Camellia fascicularis]
MCIRDKAYKRVPNNPEPLTLRCQSRDDDLGTHILNFGEDFQWSFRINVFYTTSFFCHFWWGSKQQSFDVFFYYTLGDYCKSPTGIYTCYWRVRTDGFYIANGNNATLFKLHDWT